MQWASPEDAAEIARQHTGERVGGTESYRQVHSDRDEMRKFERPFNRDQQAIRPVLTLQPGIDFVFCPLQAVKA
jgi:hypothetical protein